jgi:PAS domain S-box-containing protein
MLFTRGFLLFRSESTVVATLAGLVGLSVALCMVGFEFLKQWLHPDISVWESHILTVTFSTAIAVVASYLIIRRQHAMHREIVEEASELRRAHESLRMLAQTIRSVHEAVFVTDINENVVFVNDAFLKTHGLAGAEEIVGRNISLVRAPAPGAPTASDVLSATLGGGWRGELVNRRADGSEFPVYLSTSVVRDEQEHPVALVGVVRNITEQKRTEETLRQAQRWESIATLAGGVAHDFNNLLQTILRHTNLALKTLGTASPEHRDLQVVLHATDSAANLTRQLLAYSGRSQFRAKGVDLNRIASEQAESFRSRLPRSVTLRTEFSPALRTVNADPHQLQQVIANLVTNAIEAIGEGSGTVVVRTSERDIPTRELGAWPVAADAFAPGPHVVIDVEDDGCGIDSAIAGRIFEPFFSTKFPGRGLGLAAVHGIVRAHGGGLQVATDPGNGSRFSVAIPGLSLPSA